MALWRAKDKPPVELVVANLETYRSSIAARKESGREGGRDMYRLGNLEELEDLGRNNVTLYLKI